MAIPPLIAVANKLFGLTTGAAEADVDPLYPKLIPPLTAGAPNANGFKRIVPISGRNQPYEPELAEYPSTVFLDVIVALTPVEPVINWNTLPASVNWTDVT